VSTDAEIEQSLSSSFHKPLEKSHMPETADDKDDQFTYHLRPCFDFLCHLDPLYDVVEKLVLGFGKQLDHNKLLPGNLLMFSSDGCSNSIVCFLGVVLKKPLVHMLIEAAVTDGDVTEVAIKLYNGAPRVLTSDELFLQLLRNRLDSVNPAEFKVTLQVWECQAFLHEGHTLKSNPEILVGDFEFTSETTIPKDISNKKAAIKLPFGLNMPRKTRKTRKTVAKKKMQKGDEAKAAPHKKKMHEKMPDSSNESGDSLSFDSESEIDPNEESERAVPMSETVKSGMEQIADLAEEIQHMDSLREAAAAAIKTNSGGSRAAGSYFSNEIGMSEGGLAASARSVCLHCKKPIPKASIRFSWYYSRVRPPGWIHGYCLSSHVKESKLVEETKVKLRAMIEKSRAAGQASSSSSSSGHPSAIQQSNRESREVAEFASGVLAALSAAH